MKALSKKDKKRLTFLLVLVLVVGMAYLTRNKWLPYFQKSPSPGTASVPSNSSNVTVNTGNNVILKQGDRGAMVEELQRLINAEIPLNTPLFILPLTVDGVFGPKTEEALFKLTNKKSISVADFIANYSTK